MTAEPDFSSKIIVASGIVDHLSSGLYETPAACLKELINNSYDADATQVRVSVLPDANEIIVADDGTGMNQAEFERNFSVISESHKREVSDETASGRPKIGFIGIGFIAANEICDVMEVVSTKRGETSQIRVLIDFAKMRGKSLSERREGDDNVKFEKGDFRGWVESAEKDEHFTIVAMKGIHGNARDIFEGATPETTAGGTSLFGLSPDAYADRLSNLGTWDDLDDYSHTLVRVGLNAPVKYAPGWVPSRFAKRTKRFEEDTEALDFSILYDGMDLRKPVVLGRNGDRQLVRKFSIEGEHVAAHGYFFAQHGTLRPQQLNGVLIRLRNSAIGEYDSSFLGYRSSIAQMMRRWISAEVWIDRGLEDAMNIDRKTLRITEPAFIELQRAFHEELAKTFSLVRKEIYEEGNRERRTTNAADVVTRITEILDERDVPLSKSDRKELTASVEESDSARVRRVLKKYSVADLYDLALEVAEEELPRKYFESFAEALARRLLR